MLDLKGIPFSLLDQDAPLIMDDRNSIDVDMDQLDGLHSSKFKDSDGKIYFGGHFVDEMETCDGCGGLSYRGTCLGLI